MLVKAEVGRCDWADVVAKLAFVAPEDYYQFVEVGSVAVDA